MASQIRIFSDYELKNVLKATITGIAIPSGDLAHVSGWNAGADGGKGKMYGTTGNQIAYMSAGSGITLSGAMGLYNMRDQASLPCADNGVKVDKINNASAIEILNPSFIGFSASGTYHFTMFSDNTGETWIITFGVYTQEPESVSGQARTSWNYYSTGDIVPYYTVYMRNADIGDKDKYRMISVYLMNLDDVDYYLFAFGVTPNGEYSKDGSSGTFFYAIPCAYFEDEKPVDYIGEQSEDNSEYAFSETAPYEDKIEGREFGTGTGQVDISPFGTNTGNGTMLQIISKTQLAQICRQIYTGTAEGIFNQIEQIVSDNAHRPAEEVQAILNGIMAVHYLPAFDSWSAGSSSYLLTVSGYTLFTLVWNPMQVNDSQEIVQWNQSSEQIEPRLNCFLDYEPYTKITIKLPWMQPFDLPPSQVYGHRLSFTYTLSVITGILSVDVRIDGGIVLTRQANVKTSIPITGTGSNSHVLSEISSSIIAASKSPAGAIGGALNLADAYARAGEGVEAGKESIDGLQTFLTTRQAYAIISHPIAAIPGQKDGDDTNTNYFKHQIGMAADLTCTIGEYKGFAAFRSADLDSVDAPEEVKQDILRIIKEGVYVE